MTTATPHIETPLAGLHATPATPLSFGPEIGIRAFLLERDAGNVLMYGAPGAEGLASVGPISRAYLNHWHEAMFAQDIPGVPLFVHADDREESVRRGVTVRAAFSQRHMLDDDLEVIPTPGHTPGATAFLWDSGEHRVLFTGDSLMLRDGEWIGALLESSDRGAYLDSLALLRELEFDVLVPWAVSVDGPAVSFTDTHDARRRLDAVIARIRAGGDS